MGERGLNSDLIFNDLSKGFKGNATILAPVVQKMDTAIYQINHYP